MNMTLVNKQLDPTYKSNNYHFLPEFCVLIYKNDKRSYLICFVSFRIAEVQM